MSAAQNGTARVSSAPKTKASAKRRTAPKPAKKTATPRSNRAPAGQAWQEVPLADIDQADTTFQYRFQTPNGELVPSIRNEGQREPIDLAGTKPPYRIVDGHRRVSAAAELGSDTVKAFVHRNLSDDEAWRLAFTKNVARKNLSPLERANAMVLALQRGTSKEDLATMFSLSERQLRRYLELLDLPEAIRTVLDGKVVTMAHAKALHAFGVRNVEAWAARIKDEALDVTKLKRLLRSELGRKPRGRPKTYLKQTKKGFRVHSFTVGFDTTPEEKRKMLEALRPLLELLEAKGEGE